MRSRGLVSWLQGLAAFLRRYSRPLAVLLISVPLAAYALFRSFDWFDRPFPGFFLVSGGVVSNVSGARWPGTTATPWSKGPNNLFLSQVMAIDGQLVRSRDDVYRYVAAHAQDDVPLQYRFRRGGEEREHAIRPQRFTTSDYWETCGVLLVFGTISLVTALVVGFLQPQTRQANVFLYSGFVAGLYPITGTLLYQPDTSFVVTAIYLVSECLFPATMIHLALAFPIERQLPGSRRLWLIAPYAVGIAIAAAAFHGFYSDPPDLSVWPLTWAYTAFAFLIFCVSMIFAYVENREPLARARLRAMLVWLVAATAPVVLIFATNASSGQNVPLQYALVLGPIFFASIAYSIAKHDLFSIDRFVRQAFAYGLLSIIVIGTYALLLLIPGTFVEENPGFVGVIFVLALALVLDPLRRGVQNLVDRAYYREAWDYRKTIGEQSQALTSWLNLEAIVTHVMHLVTDEMHVESTTVCLFNEGERTTIWRRDASGALTYTETTASSPPGALNPLRGGAGADSVDALSSTIAGTIPGSGVSPAVVLPLMFQGLELGRLELGPKLSRRSFTQEDRELLQTLANQAALAIQNARLHEAKEELRQKNVELGRAYDDLKQAEAQLVQSEKMASLGRLVAGAAHQLNNPASFVHGSLANLAEYVQGFIDVIHAYEQIPIENGSARETVRAARERARLDYLLETTPRLVRVCSEGSDRIKEIVDDLRVFARADQGERVSSDVPQAIESAIRLIEHRLKHGNIRLEKDFSDVPLIEAQPAQLRQVWMNLLDNAVDAVEDQAHPLIRVAIRPSPEFSLGGVEVEIADNGVGIAPADHQRIFEPFFTSKPIGRGTGLGLSIAYGAIKNHGGAIQVVSEPGLGTTVTVRLPLAIGSNPPVSMEQTPE